LIVNQALKTRFGGFFLARRPGINLYWVRRTTDGTAFVTTLDRRALVRALATLAAYIPAPLLLAAPADDPGRKVSIRAFGPFLDTLLPQDATPSATQLGVDKALVEILRTSRRRVKMLVLGCA
jgi:hypothetical protein